MRYVHNRGYSNVFVIPDFSLVTQSVPRLSVRAYVCPSVRPSVTFIEIVSSPSTAALRVVEYVFFYFIKYGGKYVPPFAIKPVKFNEIYMFLNTRVKQKQLSNSNIRISFFIN